MPINLCFHSIPLALLSENNFKSTEPFSKFLLILMGAESNKKSKLFDKSVMSSQCKYKVARALAFYVIFHLFSDAQIFYLVSDAQSCLEGQLHACLAPLSRPTAKTWHIF